MSTTYFDWLLGKKVILRCPTRDASFRRLATFIEIEDGAMVLYSPIIWEPL